MMKLKIGVRVIFLEKVLNRLRFEAIPNILVKKCIYVASDIDAEIKRITEIHEEHVYYVSSNKGRAETRESKALTGAC